MPRRNNRKRTSRKQGSNGGRGQRLVFSGRSAFSMGYTASYSFNNVPINLYGIDRLASIMPLFELYRFTKLKFTCLPSSSGPVTMGWVPGNSTGSPSGWNYASVSELDGSRMWWPGSTRPLVIHARVVNEKPWFETANSVLAGNLMIGGLTTTAVTAYVIFEYTVVFTGMMPLNKNFLEKKDGPHLTPRAELPPLTTDGLGRTVASWGEVKESGFALADDRPAKSKSRKYVDGLSDLVIPSMEQLAVDPLSSLEQDFGVFVIHPTRTPEKIKSPDSSYIGPGNRFDGSGGETSGSQVREESEVVSRSLGKSKLDVDGGAPSGQSK